LVGRRPRPWPMTSPKRHRPPTTPSHNSKEGGRRREKGKGKREKYNKVLKIKRTNKFKNTTKCISITGTKIFMELSYTFFCSKIAPDN